MTGDRAARRDQRWARRYERAQTLAKQQSAEVNGPASRTAPPLAIVDGRDGRTYRLRLVAPGEPVTHDGAFNLAALLSSLLTRGALMPESSNSSWVVLVERQRGPWRGFDTVQRVSFDSARDAEQHLSKVRSALEYGHEIPGAL